MTLLTNQQCINDAWQAKAILPEQNPINAYKYHKLDYYKNKCVYVHVHVCRAPGVKVQVHMWARSLFRYTSLDTKKRVA